MKKLLLVKIGGGVITDKKVRYGLKQDVLTQIVGEIAKGYKQLVDTDLIIGNGAGSFAHFSAHEYGTAKGFTDDRGRLGAGWVRYDAVKLDQIVFEELLKAGVPAFSFSPSSFISVDDDKATQIRIEVLQTSLTKGLVPLVYGDVMIDATKGSTIFSTERVFDELAKTMAPTYSSIKVLHVSSEEGVLVDGSVFPTITHSNITQIEKELLGSHGIDVTGGMIHKVKQCLDLANIGVESMIVSGIIKGRVEGAIIGQETIGTKICK